MKNVTAFLILALAAQASMIVNIGGTVSGGAVVGGTNYTDNQAGVDANSALGIMDIGTFLNGVSVNFVIQNFGATSGTPTASLSLNANAFLDPAASLPLDFEVLISDTGFTTGPPLILAQTVNLLSSVGGETANATAVGYFGDSNTNFDVNGVATASATASLLAGVGTNTAGFSPLIGGSSPYSLTSDIHVTILARGSDPIQNIQLNANLTGQVPEPASYLLLGAGLILMSLLAKFKRTA
jgi:hypothetical protein